MQTAGVETDQAPEEARSGGRNVPRGGPLEFLDSRQARRKPMVGDEDGEGRCLGYGW